MPSLHLSATAALVAAFMASPAAAHEETPELDAGVSESASPDGGDAAIALDPSPHAHGDPGRPHEHPIPPHVHVPDGGVVAPADVPRETIITARRPLSAASAKTVRERDLKLRVLRRPADVLSVAPGLYVVQHAGGGKANQYFLRGFDADHGTDVALSVDGVPANLVSHGHGQGYADLNWLIPEVVERLDVLKGPYAAEQGDFATAGSMNVVTRPKFEANQVTALGGMFSTWRGLLIASPDSATGSRSSRARSTAPRARFRMESGSRASASSES